MILVPPHPLLFFFSQNLLFVDDNFHLLFIQKTDINHSLLVRERHHHHRSSLQNVHRNDGNGCGTRFAKNCEKDRQVRIWETLWILPKNYLDSSTPLPTPDKDSNCGSIFHKLYVIEIPSLSFSLPRSIENQLDFEMEKLNCRTLKMLLCLLLNLHDYLKVR